MFLHTAPACARPAAFLSALLFNCVPPLNRSPGPLRTPHLPTAGSKDGLVKLWCPKTGRNLSTLHGHKGTIMQTQWNGNGNWVLTASRDQTCKVRAGWRGAWSVKCKRWCIRQAGRRAHRPLTQINPSPAPMLHPPSPSAAELQLYDIRMLKELASFRGHNRDVTYASWHPVHEELFVSGGHDGSMIYWLASRSAPQVRAARDAIAVDACTAQAAGADPQQQQQQQQ